MHVANPHSNQKTPRTTAAAYGNTGQGLAANNPVRSRSAHTVNNLPWSWSFLRGQWRHAPVGLGLASAALSDHLGARRLSFDRRDRVHLLHNRRQLKRINLKDAFNRRVDLGGGASQSMASLVAISGSNGQF